MTKDQPATTPQPDQATLFDQSSQPEQPDQPGIAAYETLYAELQAVVTRLETGELSLEELITLYERGVTLATTCQRLLDVAGLRVQQVQQDGQIED